MNGRYGFLACTSLLLLGVLFTWAQESGGVKSYQLRSRFTIDAALQQRMPQYKEMLARLQRAGFKPAPGRLNEELYGDLLNGTIPSTGLNALRNDSYLTTIVLTPEGWAAPAEAEKTVLVRIELARNSANGSQKDTANAARKQLATIGFVENVGHDHKDHTQLLGRINNAGLNALLKPGTELASQGLTEKAGSPSFKFNPVRMAIVLPEPSDPAADKAIDKLTGKAEDKIHPDLKTMLASVDEAGQGKYIRVEATLRFADSSANSKNNFLGSSTQFVPEGRLGNVITGLIPPNRVRELANLPEVSTVRLPQSARPFAFVANKNSTAELPIQLIQLGQPRKTEETNGTAIRLRTRTRLAVFAADFRGWEAYKGMVLPVKTELLDFTPELTPDLEPAPTPAGNSIGQGAVLAAAAQAQINADEVLLVRIDESAAYQIETLGRIIAGETWNSEVANIRKAEMADEEQSITIRQQEVRVQRRIILDDFNNTEAAKKQREEFKKKQDALDADATKLAAKRERFVKLQNMAAKLQGVSHVLVGLAWSDGNTELPGQTPILRHLSASNLKSASWFQAVPQRIGQTWSGFFRDENQDGAMEFTEAKLPRTDLAFLAWKNFGVSPMTQTLPEKAVVQVTLNWSEAHASQINSSTANDPYRQPLSPLTIVVLKQRDPSGSKLPTDAFTVVSRSPAFIDRIENDNRSAVYQAITRFEVPTGGGRYAIRIEGKQATSIFPPGVAPGALEKGELHPKLVVEVVDPLKRNQGKVVLEQFATTE